jgi:hypothetical protein
MARKLPCPRTVKKITDVSPIAATTGTFIAKRPIRTAKMYRVSMKEPPVWTVRNNREYPGA